jgi:hypothetical protein
MEIEKCSLCNLSCNRDIVSNCEKHFYCSEKCKETDENISMVDYIDHR